MELWNLWLTFISTSIDSLSVYFGLSESLAIISFTLLARAILMPVSIKSAYNMHKNRLKMEAIKPDIERLRARYKNDPGELSKQTMKIYKKNGVRFLDRITLFNIGSQGFLGLGVFQSLRQMAFGSKFIWIANIAKPDVILAIIVGVLTYVSMLIMPGAAEQHNLLFFILPALVSTIVLIGFPSAVGLYWAASNAMTMLQALILRVIIYREQKAPGGV